MVNQYELEDTKMQNNIKRTFKIHKNTVYKSFKSDDGFIEIKKPILLNTTYLNKNLFKEMGIRTV